MSAIKKKHFSWAGNQEKKVPSYTLQQYRVSHIKKLGGTCGQLVDHLHSWAKLICPFLFYTLKS